MIEQAERALRTAFHVLDSSVLRCGKIAKTKLRIRHKPSESTAAGIADGADASATIDADPGVDDGGHFLVNEEHGGLALAEHN